MCGSRPIDRTWAPSKILLIDSPLLMSSELGLLQMFSMCLTVLRLVGWFLRKLGKAELTLSGVSPAFEPNSRLDFLAEPWSVQIGIRAICFNGSGERSPGNRGDLQENFEIGKLI